MIAVTALAMLPDREKGLALGFTEYLVKPVSPEEIKTVVLRYISQPGDSSAA